VVTVIASELTILPAVDIMNGRAVQLVRGKQETARDFGDPVEAALRWSDMGAKWLHIVDLDAAFGTGNNAAIMTEIASSVPAHIEASGGLRDDAAVDKMLSAGCARVSVGTAAVENPDWCASLFARLGDQVAVSLDAAGDALASRGWVQASGSLYDTLGQLADAGCQRFIVTDTAADGTLTGPNLELLGSVCAHLGLNDEGRPRAAVVASGGVSTLEHIVQLRGLTSIGIDGVIIGTAIYTGEIDLAAALVAATQ